MTEHSYINYNGYGWALLTLLLVGLPAFVHGQTTRAGADFDFGGRLIVSVSDADMLASTYLDGHLGAPIGPDALSIIRLDKPVSELKAVEIGVSNSVTGPPSCTATR